MNRKLLVKYVAMNRKLLVKYVAIRDVSCNPTDYQLSIIGWKRESLIVSSGNMTLSDASSWLGNMMKITSKLKNKCYWIYIVLTAKMANKLFRVTIS